MWSGGGNTASTYSIIEYDISCIKYCFRIDLYYYNFLSFFISYSIWPSNSSTCFGSRIEFESTFYIENDNTLCHHIPLRYDRTYNVSNDITSHTWKIQNSSNQILHIECVICIRAYLLSECIKKCFAISCLRLKQCDRLIGIFPSWNSQ